MGFLVSNCVLEKSTFTEVLKLEFGCNRFDKMTEYNLQTRMRSKKKSRDKVIKWLKNFNNHRVYPLKVLALYHVRKYVESLE